MPNNRRFKFRFGQQVIVCKEGPENGAFGHIINGQIHPDGREVYGVDAPGTGGEFLADELNAFSAPTKK